MFVIIGIGLVIVGAWLGMERSDDWASIISLWLVVIGSGCVILG